MDIYTDGSCFRNPGPGGWGVWVPEIHLTRSGSSPDTTNNRMEMTAITEALKYIKCLQEIEYNIIRHNIYSDSEWSIKILLGFYRARSSLDLVMAAKDLLDTLHPRPWLKWIKGHSGNPANDYVDRLAKNAAKVKT